MLNEQKQLRTFKKKKQSTSMDDLAASYKSEKAEFRATKYAHPML